MLIGRRIRYKFVCTPPEGYVPSELDAQVMIVFRVQDSGVKG